jgi:hypothetical protein
MICFFLCFSILYFLKMENSGHDKEKIGMMRRGIFVHNEKQLKPSRSNKPYAESHTSMRRASFVRDKLRHPDEPESIRTRLPIVEMSGVVFGLAIDVSTSSAVGTWFWLKHADATPSLHNVSIAALGITGHAALPQGRYRM